MATFVLTLASCLNCDGRRVDVGDQIAIFLDPYKFPSNPDPIRAAVLEVRTPVPPEPANGAISIEVEASDSDMPSGMALLEHDDINHIQCIDCCWRNEERLSDLESQIPGTKETILTELAPFIPSSFEVQPQGGPSYNLSYNGELNGKPFWSNGGTFPFWQFIGSRWNWVPSAGQNYAALSDAPFPWLVSGPWERSPSSQISSIGVSDVIYDQLSPIPPSNLDPLVRDSDLVLLKDRDQNLWSWNGSTWDVQTQPFEWDLSDPYPSPKVGSVAISSSAGTFESLPVHPGDAFVRVSESQISRIGSLGWFSSQGVKLTGAQSITGAKSFTYAEIGGGAINSTPIGSVTPSTGSFTNISATSTNFTSGQFGTLGVSGNFDVFGDSLFLGQITSGSNGGNAGTIRLNANDSAFGAILTTSGLTANRTQGLPNRSGTVALTDDADGFVQIDEIGGIHYGQATLVAGTVAVAIPGLTTSSIAVGLVPTTAASNHLHAACTADTLTITSSNAGDTRTINYLVIV